MDGEMTVVEELEMAAHDCEETAAEAGSYGTEYRAWLSMANRIRHAIKRIQRAEND